MQFTKEDIKVLGELRGEFVGRWVNCDGMAWLVDGVVCDIDTSGVLVRLLGSNDMCKVVEFGEVAGGFVGSARKAQVRLREMLVGRRV